MIDDDPAQDLVARIADRAPEEAATLLETERADTVARALERLSPSRGVAVLWRMSEDRRRAVLAAATPEWAAQWTRNHAYDEEAIGRAMAPAFAVMPPTLTVAEAIERLREIVSKALVSYIFVTDDTNKLLGVLVFREMLLASREARLSDVMIHEPFHLSADTPLPSPSLSVR